MVTTRADEIDRNRNDLARAVNQLTETASTDALRRAVEEFHAYMWRISFVRETPEITEAVLEIAVGLATDATMRVLSALSSDPHPAELLMAARVCAR